MATAPSSMTRRSSDRSVIDDAVGDDDVGHSDFSRHSGQTAPVSPRRCGRASGRATEFPRVGMLRRAKSVFGVGLFDELAGLHDRDAIAHLAHHREVVADEQKRRDPVASRRSFRRLRICACTETSSEEVGSSQTISADAAPSARAMEMPLSLSAGKCVRDSAAPSPRSRPTASSSCATSPLASARRPQGDRTGSAPTRSSRYECGVEGRIGILEDHLERLPQRADAPDRAVTCNGPG